MAVGKNKRMSKGKKGQKKKIGDPFLKKEWYELKAPSMFHVRHFGKTLVSKSAGTRIAADSLKGRVYEVNLADLNNDEDQAFRKIKLCCEDVQGKSCLTDFHGMSITRDKLCSLIRKWYSLIEAHVDVKTTDGYTLRMFCIASTKKGADQVKTTCYARSSQIRAIRKKMVEIMITESSRCLLRDLVKKFIPEMIGKEIEKHCKSIYPLQNVLVRKVRILKKPKVDVTRLMELHGEGSEDSGKKMVEQEAAEAQNILSAEIKKPNEEVTAPPNV
eukprot:GHVQ01018613.1.p1 GENE.GHVQ01018613.1~~GHVQ01018613.1.p1  ORF type:complete len:288 (+),score=45.66 GHVQ01018613.1:48-866(+)